MPGMDGFEVLEGLHGDEAWREVPVIIVIWKLNRHQGGA